MKCNKQKETTEMTTLFPISLPSSPFTLGEIARWVLASVVGEPEVRSRAADERFLGMVSRHNPLITKICFFFASNTNDFDDLRQDVLLNLWRGLPGFRGECSEVTWIYRLCFNTCVSTVRRNARATMPSLDDGRIAAYDVADDDASAEADISLLHRCIGQLAPTDRSMVMMQLDGRTYEEIAEVVGIPRNTVATRLRRARLKLKELLTKENS